MNPLRKNILALAASVLLGALGLAPAAAQTVVTFADGREGFDGPQGAGGATRITPYAGHDRPSLHTVFDDFGITIGTSTNTAFIGDLTRTPALELSLDVKTRSIQFFGDEVSRTLIVELRDFDDPQGGLPYTSVWFDLGTLSKAKRGWQHLSVAIADTSATALPAGWGGYGAEDPTTGAPKLPDDRTFASVLASVNQFVFTTLVPGYVYGNTRFDVLVDNIAIRPAADVPEPATVVLLAAGLGLVGVRARRGERGMSRRRSDRRQRSTRLQKGRIRRRFGR